MVEGKGILGCTDMKQFWVRWERTSLQVGEGGTDTTPFIEYRPRNSSISDINVIGFASDSVSQAEWQLPQYQGWYYRRMVLYML